MTSPDNTACEIARATPSVRSIAILCSCLEPGRDGVGDQARHLAEALLRKGVTCNLLALNDRQIDRPYENMLGADISVVRLPSSMPRRTRAHIATRHIASWRPDWISLQIVAYGFSNKGILYPELLWLPQLLAPYRVALMMHELWVGLSVFASTKNRIVGLLQRHALIGLLRNLAPSLIHTSNEYYQEVLRHVGIQAGLLPIFGNIPVTAGKADWLPAALRERGIVDWSPDLPAHWLFAMFGSIIPNWPAAPLFQALEKIAARHKKKVVIAIAGNIGSGAALVTEWRRRFPKIDFVSMGHRSEAEISELLNSAHFGITSHPRELLGKSSSALAMFQHGLPVICNWGSETQASLSDPLFSRFQVWECDEQLESRLLQPFPRFRQGDLVDMIATRYLSDLNFAAAAKS